MKIDTILSIRSRLLPILMFLAIFFFSTPVIICLSLTKCNGQSRALKGVTAIKVGEPAPPFKVGTWVKGVPINFLSIEQIYVIELTQVNCAPCRLVIPHLTELEKKYAGKVRVISVYVGENDVVNDDTSYYSYVRRFLATVKTKIGYSVAIDEPGQYMLNHWLRAIKLGGTPTSFIINRKGNVVWYGPSLDERFTPSLVQVVNQDTVTTPSQITRSDKLEQAIRMAREGQYERSLRLIDSLIEVVGQTGIAGYAERKLEILCDYNEDSAYAYAKIFLKIKPFWGLGDVLTSLSNELRFKIETGKLKHLDWNVAISLLERARQIHRSQSIQMVYGDLATEARMYAIMGRYDKAMDSQKAAIDHLKKYNPQEYKMDIGRRADAALEKYQQQLLQNQTKH